MPDECAQFNKHRHPEGGVGCAIAVRLLVRYAHICARVLCTPLTKPFRSHKSLSDGALSSASRLMPLDFNEFGVGHCTCTEPGVRLKPRRFPMQPVGFGSARAARAPHAQACRSRALCSALSALSSRTFSSVGSCQARSCVRALACACCCGCGCCCCDGRQTAAVGSVVLRTPFVSKSVIFLTSSCSSRSRQTHERCAARPTTSCRYK